MTAIAVAWVVWFAALAFWIFAVVMWVRATRKPL